MNQRERVPGLLSVIMPFYNEEATLERIVSRVLGADLPVSLELVLVDDGSTDSGHERISRFIQDPRVTYIRSPRRRGKGAAVSLGISASRGGILLIQDADLEYDPSEYSRVLGLILGKECDFVLGSRVLGAGSWKIHEIAGRPVYSWALNAGLKGLTMIFGVVFPVGLTDPATMMKVFRRECLDGIEFKSRGFDWDWEILCKFLRRGLVPLEAPISYKGRSPDEGKKLRMWKDGWQALFAIARYSVGPSGGPRRLEGG